MVVAGMAREQAIFVYTIGQSAVDGVDQYYRSLFARIVAALENRKAGQLSFGQAQPDQNSRPQVVRTMVQRQSQLGDSQHQQLIRTPKRPRSTGQD
jgi:hypothetical protein